MKRKLRVREVLKDPTHAKPDPIYLYNVKTRNGREYVFAAKWIEVAPGVFRRHSPSGEVYEIREMIVNRVEGPTIQWAAFVRGRFLHPGRRDFLLGESPAQYRSLRRAKEAVLAYLKEKCAT